MAPPDETRQLPGVKGQWILCSECPPTEADVDVDGEVRTYLPDPHAWGSEYRKLSDLGPHDYWCPSDHADPRPFTLPALPAPEQAAAVKRKFVQLIPHPHGHTLWAIADDKTAWFIYEQNGGEDYPRNLRWHQLLPLPDREVSDA
jgi:hypothetical protein